MAGGAAGKGKRGGLSLLYLSVTLVVDCLNPQVWNLGHLIRVCSLAPLCSPADWLKMVSLCLSVASSRVMLSISAAAALPC